MIIPGYADYEVNEATCDGLDNDCDGSADNGLTAPDNDNQNGVCLGSTKSCDGVNGWINDYTGIGADYQLFETFCDGKDNDCDGAADNNLTAPDNSLQDGICLGSTQSCTGVGGWVDDYSGITAYEAGVEATCDTLDNNCDGSVDENNICSTKSFWLLMLPAITKMGGGPR